MRREKGFIKKSKILVLYIGVMMVLAGCGDTPVQEREEVILIDPSTSEISFERVTRRDLLNADTYTALVCPDTKQYGLETAAVFEAYDVYPGKEIKKGTMLLHGNSESIDARIENLEKSIAEAEESYRDYMEENTPKNEELLQKMEDYQEIMEDLESEKPKGWEDTYNFYNKEYISTHQQELELNLAIQKRSELYELDHVYQLSQLEYLKQDKKRNALFSGMSGVVADLKIMTQGGKISGGEILATVADLAVKKLRCEYIAQKEILSAEDIYALINGSRYEVEYVPMDTAEYTKLKKQNGKVYSTFILAEDTPKIQFGDQALIVIVKDKITNALTVSTDAVKRDGATSYVYVLNGSKRDYTVIKTGITSGMYTEVISGLKEGDNVLADSPVRGETDYVLQRGESSVAFKASGTLYYPFSDWTVNQVAYGTVYLEEILVRENQEVKKGEVLARIRVEGDASELEQKKRRLQREEERLADLRETKDPDDEAVAAKEQSIEELRELIAAMESDYSQKEIKAGVAGVIVSVTELKAGDEVKTGEKLFLIADESRSLIKVEDKGNQLAFGQECTVTYTNDLGSEVSIPGSVVTLNSMGADQALTNHIALIQVPDEEMKNMTGSRKQTNGRWTSVSYEVNVQLGKAENVVLVPKTAVTVYEGYTYVLEKLESGETVYRYFLAGGSDSSNYWVADGLMEGMKICLE